MQALANKPAARVPWRYIEWPGSSVVILASGPSLTVEQCEQVRAWRDAGGAHRVIAINTTFRRAPWADLLYACDAVWWKVYFAEVSKSFDVKQCWCTEMAATINHSVRYVESQRLPGLGRRPGLIHQGGNSGYMAINLAYQAGANKIVLVGFDMHGGHWHGAHPLPLTNAPRETFRRHLEAFPALAKDLVQDGVEVLNATPGTALQCFPKADLSECLK